METKTAVLLSEAFENELRLGGEIGEMILDNNSGTGYHWECVPDNSGVYSIIEEVNLHCSPAIGMVGTPTKRIWKIEGIREGEGSVLFENYPPGSRKPEKTLVVKLKVVK